MRILFCGRKKASAELLREISADTRFEIVGALSDSHLPVSPTTQAATELAIPVLDFKELVAGEASGAVEFDLIISVLYWRRFPTALINRARLGAINFHPAPLPQYKGCAGYNLAILEGRPDWAVTAHYMDENIDTGGIIEVDWFAIDELKETARSLEQTSLTHLKEQVIRVLDQVSDVQAILPSQPNVGGRYVSRVEMEEMKAIKPGDNLGRKIRAFWFPPYHGAYLEIDGAKYTLVDQSVLRDLADPDSSSLFLEPKV